MPHLHRRSAAALLASCLWLTALVAQAAPSVPSFFSENMILQRDVPVPLWGWADADEPISIIYGDHQLKTVAKDGRWKVELPAMPAGGPHTLAISGTNPNDTLLFSQVLVGEVWIVCGQSNAILPVQTWVSDATVAATPLLAPVRGKGYPSATSAGFDDQVAPLAPFPVRGVVYYQGEMNAGRGNGPFYEAGLTALIHDWRTAWNDPQLPFLIVQLAGFIKHLGPEDKRLDMDAATLATFTGENVDHGFCHVRQAQLDVSRKMPRVGLAVTTDLGDPYDIHPRKKLPVAERLMLQARRLAYGESVVADSPYPERVEFVGDACRITFGAAGDGLAVRGDMLKGFELSPGGTTFVAATAAIEGDTVVVTSPDAKPPVAVRYAWAGWPDATLTNKAGLPATPFRFPPPTPRSP